MEERFVVCRTLDIDNGQVSGFVLARAEESGASGARPILITRKANQYFGFENACPHQGLRLDKVPGAFLDEGGNFITCGNHNAQFDLDTGHCFIGPCQGERLTAIPLVIDDGDICLTGIRLVEEDGLDVPGPGETPEVVITPG